jgi:hypothetical protein
VQRRPPQDERHRRAGAGGDEQHSEKEGGQHRQQVHGGHCAGGRAAAATGYPAVLQSLPAPLFAGLAALALVGDGTGPELPTLLAGAGALLGASRRSLGLALACGVTGFLLGGVLVG